MFRCSRPEFSAVLPRPTAARPGTQGPQSPQGRGRETPVRRPRPDAMPLLRCPGDAAHRQRAASASAACGRTAALENAACVKTRPCFFCCDRPCRRWSGRVVPIQHKNGKKHGFSACFEVSGLST
jgi:hypothetical protein